MIPTRTVVVATWILFCLAPAGMALDGKLLVVDNTQKHHGGDISIVECSTGAKTKIETGYCWGPVFSPDGTKLALVKGEGGNGYVIVCNQDGSGKQSISVNAQPWHMCNLSWADDGYIYWTAKSSDFRRVPATGGAEESYRTFPAIVGISGQEGMSSGDVCNSVLRGACTEFHSGNNEVHALDVSAGTIVHSTTGHCNGSISADGALVCANRNSHDTADIYDFTTWNVAHVITAAAAAGGFTGIAFSNSSSAHVVYVSEHEPTQAYVCEVATNTSHHICAGQPFDYLPPGGSPSSPVISLDQGALTFTAEEGSSDPADQSVQVTNAGEGTLADASTSVAYDAGSGWIAATASGGGNAQTIGVAVSITGLAAGTYEATVTVQCANASPATSTFTVTLEVTDGPDYSPSAAVSANVTFGRSPLTVQFTGSGTAYTGRSITGYHWEFGDGQTSTQQNPSNTYTHAGSAPVARVAVLTVTDDQGDTGTDSVSITVQPWAGYTILAPQAGDVWYIGTTRRIRFTGTNVVNAVLHYQTSPAGMWKSAFPPTRGEIANNDAYWGEYPWEIPNDASSQCRIAISEYMNQAEVAYSETFEIRAISDGDGDGMDDDWESLTFGDTTTADATSDFDDDGTSDVDEFFSGGDPKLDDSLGGAGAGFSCAAGTARAPDVAGLLLAAAACLLALIRSPASRECSPPSRRRT